MLRRRERGSETFGPVVGGVGRPAPSAEVPLAFTPEFLEVVDHDRLIDDVARFFDLGRDEVERRWGVYRGFHEAKGYERALGEFKTLCLEEAFVLCIALGLVRPRTIVEVGTQNGKVLCIDTGDKTFTGWPCWGANPAHTGLPAGKGEK